MSATQSSLGLASDEDDIAAQSTRAISFYTPPISISNLLVSP
ncbi:MAG: hypothetical protein ABWK15_09655 [Dissulfuribacterales bacterium]